MKQRTNIIIGIIMIFMLANTAIAVDINALDRVSVLMTKPNVLSLLGAPDNVIDVGSGLKADIYKLNNMEPMVGAGCIYEDDQRLAGQTFIFQGEMDKEAAEHLKKLGFTVMEEHGGTLRLLGKDDDTGQPIVVNIALNNGLTVITTFEKGFYDRRVKQP
jgi:hypothetical protein